jgi:hypothetical protein
VPDDLLTILSAHAELPHRTEWLFAAGGDDPPHQNTVGHRWRSTLRAAGLPAALLRVRTDRGRL